MNIKFAKMTENAVIPSKRREDAGYDVYSNINDDEMIVIPPHSCQKFRTGITSAISPDYYIAFETRSSIGAKNITVNAGIIDSGYRGEWIVILSNHNNVPVICSKNPSILATQSVRAGSYLGYENSKGIITLDLNKAIAQAIVKPSFNLTTTEIPLQKLQAIPSERGEGREGSSGK